MRLVAQLSNAMVDHELETMPRQTTLGDLAAALDLRPHDAGYLVDGVAHDASMLVADLPLLPGSVVTTADTPRPEAVANAPSGLTEIGISGGWDAGHRLVLSAGDHLVGELDETATDSARDLTGDLIGSGALRADRFVVRTGDGRPVIHPCPGSGVVINGRLSTEPVLFDDGVAIAADTGFSLLSDERGQRADVSDMLHEGPARFNRPPRTRIEPPAAPLVLPTRPEPHETPRKLSMAMMLSPLPIGLLMVLVFRRWIFAAFILMTPIMVLARWFESRRTARKDRARFEAEMTAALADAHRRCTAHRDDEERRRRRVQPDIAELRRRAEVGTPSLWERRRGDEDFGSVTVGWGDEPWRPGGDEGLDRFPELATMLASQPPLASVPVVVELDASIAVGLVGARARSMAIARSMLLQATTLSGPADLEVLIVTTPERLTDWDWAKWLPHLAAPVGGFRVAASASAAAEAIDDLLISPAASKASRDAALLEGPLRLVVVDDEELATAAASPIRRELRADSRLRALVISDSAHWLPRVCTTVVTVTPSADTTQGETVSVHRPLAGTTVDHVLAAGVSERTAATWARSLTRFTDPEAALSGSSMPGSITLRALRDLTGPLDPDLILRNWQQAGPAPTPAAVLGRGSLGPLDVDLVRDGPHALIAGTTGSGKSELLRTLVVSMALNVPPDHLNFVLIDFKGGGAFDMVADLPHVVSVVTDLDEHLAARALRCLRAELRHREERLREAGASDISDFHANQLGDKQAALPRLVVIIDEFATLAGELPEFLDSLVDIAQRGRSLGVHMILATQRPSGVVDKKIKANTNLRIALRVQDAADSDDVIGARDAANLSRGQAGRAFARFGSSEIVPFQTALVSAPTPDDDQAELSVRPFALVPDAAMERSSGSALPNAELTDAQVCVTAIGRANERGGYQPARVPWPEPLPASVPLPEPGTDEIAQLSMPIGLADEPDRQRRILRYWSRADGNIAVYGVDAVDNARALAAFAVGLCRRNRPDRLHLYVFDFGCRLLAPLGDLDHCGGTVGPDDTERADRLLHHLENEVQRRRSRPDAADTMLIVIIDNYPAVVESFEERGEVDAASRFASVVRDGPALGLMTFASSTTERGIPLRVSSNIETRLVGRLGDPTAYMVFGIAARDVPTFAPMRVLDPVVGQELQLHQIDDLDHAVRTVNLHVPASADPAPPIRTLGTEIPAAALSWNHSSMTTDEWRLPVGILAANLQTAHLTLAAGEHAVISGGPRTGRTTALSVMAHAARELSPGARIVAVTPRRSSLLDEPAIDRCVSDGADTDELRMLIERHGPTLVLVDDVEAVDDALVAVLTDALAQRRDDRHLIIAGRPDTIRQPMSWCRPVRESRTGVLLCPAPADGDVVKSQLPMRRPEVFPTGRGFIVTQGVPERVHLVTGPTSAAHRTPNTDRQKTAPTVRLPDPRTLTPQPTAQR